MVNRQPTLHHHLFQIPVAERITQVPPDAKEDDDILEVSSAEQHRPVFTHRITLPKLALPVCNTSPSEDILSTKIENLRPQILIRHPGSHN